MSTTPTFLCVPFAAKDRVKALGARWDGTRRQWFVPAHADIAPFAEWMDDIPSTPVAGAVTAAPSTHGTSPANEQQMPLADYLNRVQRVVQQHLSEAAWVVAEITEASLRNGHLYLTLSQTDETGSVVASAKAIAFSAARRSWFEQFAATVGAQPAAGMRVLAKVCARFDARYGFSLDLHAIDPAFTLGEFAQRVAKIRTRLQQEGHYERQRTLLRPEDFTSIAVVAPAGAAGLGDFSRDTGAAQAAGLLAQRVYHATFQGADAEASVTAAIARAVADHATQPVDAIVIIRGGGSALDLGWLDAYLIAHAVSTSPVPVLVGIGHERDRGILDEVACQPFDTPSKVSAHILRCIVDCARTARNDLDRIARRAEARIAQVNDGQRARWGTVRDRAAHALARRRASIAAANHRIAARSQQLVLRATQAAAAGWEHLVTRARTRLDRGRQLSQRRFESSIGAARLRLQIGPRLAEDAWQTATRAAARRLERLTHGLDRLELRVRAADPHRILQRGFVLVRDAAGRIVRDSQGQAGPVTLQWHDGVRSAEVLETGASRRD